MTGDSPPTKRPGTNIDSLDAFDTHASDLPLADRPLHAAIAGVSMDSVPLSSDQLSQTCEGGDGSSTAPDHTQHESHESEMQSTPLQQEGEEHEGEVTKIGDNTDSGREAPTESAHVVARATYSSTLSSFDTVPLHENTRALILQSGRTSFSGASGIGGVSSDEAALLTNPSSASDLSRSIPTASDLSLSIPTASGMSVRGESSDYKGEMASSFEEIPSSCVTPSATAYSSSVWIEKQ